MPWRSIRQLYRHERMERHRWNEMRDGHNRSRLAGNMNTTIGMTITATK